jgi:glycerophosphoryl diester phosphodiesterase
LVSDAHAAGLKVHAYTFRAENQYLPADLRSGGDPNQLGDLEGELKVYLNAGLDGFFTDHADFGVRSRDAFL